MEYLGLLFELIFLAMGVYIYLFAIGRVKAKNKEARERAEAFRRKNGWWLRLLSLLLIAITIVNIFLHVQHVLGAQ